MRFLHRHTGYVDWHDVRAVDWDEGVVHLRSNRLEPVL
jgi:hypothetical protein